MPILICLDMHALLALLSSEMVHLLALLFFSRLQARMLHFVWPLITTHSMLLLLLFRLATIVDRELTTPFDGVLIPGSYSINSAAAANLAVSLDCQGKKTTVFNFLIGGALSLNNDVKMINGICKVHWAVIGAVNI